jgi:hypothetical protein
MTIFPGLAFPRIANAFVERSSRPMALVPGVMSQRDRESMRDNLLPVCTVAHMRAALRALSNRLVLLTAVRWPTEASRVSV